MRLFKYKPFSLHALKILVQDELYLAHARSELNDPVDCALIVDGQTRPLDVTVCSLSKTHTSPLMWSQYADGHKGVCFELDYSAVKEAASTERISFGPVKYLDPAAYKNELDRNVTPIGSGNSAVDYDKMAVLKTTPFAHEREVRLVSKFPGQRSTLKVPGLVTDVYVGINMLASDREFLEEIVGIVNQTNNRTVSVWKAVDLTKKYRLRFRRLETSR